MIMMSRIEAEILIRQQELLREMERQQMAEDAQATQISAKDARPIHSQFFSQRFGGLLRRLKTQEV